MGEIKRGDIFLVNLDPVVGSEQGKTRPVLVVQNDVGNKYSPVVIVAAITSQIYKAEYPTNVFLPKEKSGLSTLIHEVPTIYVIIDALRKASFLSRTLLNWFCL